MFAVCVVIHPVEPRPAAAAAVAVPACLLQSLSARFSTFPPAGGSAGAAGPPPILQALGVAQPGNCSSCSGKSISNEDFLEKEKSYFLDSPTFL